MDLKEPRRDSSNFQGKFINAKLAKLFYLLSQGVWLSMSKDSYLLRTQETIEFKYLTQMGHFYEHSVDGDKMMESSKDWKELL